jgi:hypothetical protein
MAWGWDTTEVATLFRACASFFRAAPWLTVADDEVLSVHLPGDRTWHVAVLGQAEETFGVALYGDQQDREDLYQSEVHPAAREEGTPRDRPGRDRPRLQRRGSSSSWSRRPC